MCEKEYDLNAYYLYDYGCFHRIGKIEKVNEKSIRMDNGIKILKEDFHKAYKLNEEEEDIYRKELIKKISNSIEDGKEFLSTLKKLKNALNMSSLVSINTEDLQKEIDRLTEVIKDAADKKFVIHNQEYEFCELSESLITEE